MIARRHVLAAGAAGSAALALAACGGDSGGSGGEVDGEGKTLTFWLMEGTNASADAYIEELKTAFTEATGATLDVQVQPWDGAHDKFVTAMAGGTGPDVAEVGTTWVPEFADAGGIDDLSEDIEAAGLADGLVEGLVEAGSLDGGTYGMPWYAGVRSILANREMLEAAGVAEQPQSWDDLLTMITTLKEHDPDWIPFPVAGGSIFSAMPFVWGAGG
ncbi:MAG TPA: extracellular solute-binding protein, partial [Brachybacterium paraconglomeratum]|nr:extracellular solute-binding protein [Brachybacterium paraconglomeratum]